MKLRLFQLCLGALLGARVLAAAPDLAALWQERLKSVVAVEFFTETEIDRRPVQTFGTVIDDQGTIIFPSQAISDRLL